MTEAEPVDLSKVDASEWEEWRALSFVDKIAWLKATISMYDLVELFGLEVTAGDKIVSPWNPDERTPSCHVYEDHVWCFSTGQGGDIIDVAVVLLGNPPPEKRNKLLDQLKDRSLRAGLEFGQVEHQQPRQLTDFTAQLVPFPKMQAIQLGDWTYGVDRFGLRQGPKGDVYVPHADANGVYGVKVRYGSGNKGSWAGSQFSHRLYAAPHVWSAGFMPAERAVICEGESDAWALASVIEPGVDVYALPSGAGTWKDHWLEDLKCYTTVWLAMDHDRAGKTAEQKLLLKVGYMRAKVLEFPTLMNDVREAVESGWRPELR